MANQPWLDEVQRQLAENGLPPSYIRRFMDELADHLEDLMEETMSKETNHFGSALPHHRANTSPAEHGGRNETNHLAQLGEPSEIANAATIAYSQRTFFGRHPVAKFLVFGISPVFSMTLAFCFTLTCMILLCWLCNTYCAEQANNYIRSFKNPAAFGSWVMSVATLILPATLLTILYSRWADRSKLNPKWMLLSCFVVSIISMATAHIFIISEIPGKSTYTIGFSFPPAIPQQYVQLLVPLVMGLWFMRRTRKKSTEMNKEDSLQAAA